MDHYVVIIGIFSGDRCRSLQHLGTKYLKGGKQITSPAKKTRITCFIFEERAFILNRHTKIEAHTLHTPHKNVCRTHVTLCYTSITLLHLKSDTQRSIVIHTFIYFTASLGFDNNTWIQHWHIITLQTRRRKCDLFQGWATIRVFPVGSTAKQSGAVSVISIKCRVGMKQKTEIYPFHPFVFLVSAKNVEYTAPILSSTDKKKLLQLHWRNLFKKITLNYFNTYTHTYLLNQILVPL